MADSENWKDFYLAHPWFPRRLLIEKFGIETYTIDNWKRANHRVEVALDQDNWKISREMSREQALRTLSAAWKYYLKVERSIELDADDAVPQLLQLSKISKSGFGFLLDHNYLKLIGGYEDWMAQGFTATAFALSHIYPGRDYLDRRGILPAMFFQTHTIAIDRNDVLGLMEHIYIRHIARLPSGAAVEDVDRAKRVFYARSTETGFATRVKFRGFGLNPNMTDAGWKDLRERLAIKFGIDLGLEVDPQGINWSAERFRMTFPDVDYRRCRYCGRSPVDLHHLLPRSDFPEFVFEKSNVVPLCVIVHAAITRNSIIDDQRNAYMSAIADWRQAPNSNRISSFDGVMRALHDSIYGDVGPPPLLASTAKLE